MPALDGTGPLGYGPMTGGRRGRCTYDPVTGAPVWNPGTVQEWEQAHGRRGRRRAMTRLERIEAKLEETLDRLARLEGSQ
jgi:hypothetical protein